VAQTTNPTGPWNSVFRFPIAPLRVTQIYIDDDQIPDSKGNNNLIPEPGEIIEVIPLLENVSSQSIYSTNGKLVTSIPNISIWNNVAGANGTIYNSCRFNIISGVSQPIDAGTSDVQPENVYVFNYSNPLPYQSLPFNLQFNAYLNENKGLTWQMGGILIKWEDTFEMKNGMVTLLEESMDDQVIPTRFELSQNYPNPINPSTVIKYSIPIVSRVILKVFDIIGNEIETLVDQEKHIGIYEVNWNPENLSSGVYLYRLQTAAFTQTREMILLR
jgi:hypothetical protein